MAKEDDEGAHAAPGYLMLRSRMAPAADTIYQWVVLSQIEYWLTRATGEERRGLLAEELARLRNPAAPTERGWVKCSLRHMARISHGLLTLRSLQRGAQDLLDRGLVMRQLGTGSASEYRLDLCRIVNIFSQKKIDPGELGDWAELGKAHAELQKLPVIDR